MDFRLSAWSAFVDVTQVQQWQSRGHFFSAAAEAMRRILIESARRKQSRKRGGDFERVPCEMIQASSVTGANPDLLLDIDEGISRLAKRDPEAAELLKLRLFAGVSLCEAGEMLGMSRSTTYRTWDYLRAWFAIHYGS